MDFYSYHDHMMHTKSLIYIIMGLLVLGFWGLWRFITARDEAPHTPSEHHKE